MSKATAQALELESATQVTFNALMALANSRLVTVLPRQPAQSATPDALMILAQSMLALALLTMAAMLSVAILSDAQLWSAFLIFPAAQAELPALLVTMFACLITVASNQLLNADLLHQAHQLRLSVVEPHQLFALADSVLILSAAAQSQLPQEDSSKTLALLKFLMVAALLLQSNVQEVNVSWVKSSARWLSTAQLAPSDALTTLALNLLHFATVLHAPVPTPSSAGMVFASLTHLTAQQDLHAQPANQSNATTVPALTFFQSALITLLVLHISQSAATLEIAGNTKKTAQPFQPALPLFRFFARMDHAENPFNTAKVLPTSRFLPEIFAALMVHSHPHSHCAQLVLPALLVMSNAGMDLVTLTSLYALLLVMPTTVLLDAQMALSDQASLIAQPE
jgi:hypothetical protein